MKTPITTLLLLLILTPYFATFVPPAYADVGSSDQNFITTENAQPTEIQSEHPDSHEAFPLINEPPSVEVLQIYMNETIRIQENGSSELELLIEIPSSPLADIYRRSFGVPNDTDSEEEMAASAVIAINRNEITENITQIAIPATLEGFQNSIEQQQQTSLGIITEILDCKLVPRTVNNGLRISIEAHAILPITDVSCVESDFKWEISLGPQNNAAKSNLATLELVQLMLASIPGEQVYENIWSTKIVLPQNTQLVNYQKIDGQSWKMDFGGHTSMSAWISLDKISTIFLTERTIVTEQEMTTTLEHAYSADYKIFRIILLSSNLPLDYSEEEGSITWDFTWSETWSDSQSFPFSQGPLEGLLTVSGSITISGYIGWDFDLFGGVTRFESWMSLIASVDIDFEATATAYYDHTWTQTFFDWSIHFDAFALGLPVWADLTLTATGVLSVSAYGQLTVTAGASASATFTAGVRWTPATDWEGIFSVSSSANYRGPTIEAEAGVWVRPSVRFRIAFLFYSIAGPYIEFEPYAILTLTCRYPPPHGEWSIAVYLRITAGATFAGWLKTLLGLDDYSVVLTQPDILLWSDSGTWGSSSMSISIELDPSTSPAFGQVRVYGTAIFSDGSPVSYTDVITTVAGSSWTTTTDSSGYYSQYITAPERTDNVHVFISTGSLSASNSKRLTVTGDPDPIHDRYTLEEIATCKDVQSSDPYDPIDRTSCFRRTDERAIVWIHLTDVYRYGEKSPLISVKWEWYDPLNPSGPPYFSNTREIDDPGPGKYWIWKKVWGWIWINGHTPEDREGRWHCKVYIDEGSGYELVDLLEFCIGYEVTDRTTAEGVQEHDPYEPIRRTNSFFNTHERVWGWIRLDCVAESLEIKWEWYKPDGGHYATFYWSTGPPTGYCWGWYKAWCWITVFGAAPQSIIGDTWEVRAYIEDVYGNWDLEFSQYFIISDNTPPGIPGTPVDEGDFSSDGTLTWTWTAASEDWYIDQYQIQVGTTPGGSDVFDGYTDSLSMTLYDLPSSQYYARVRAMNTVGQWSISWSRNSDGIIVDKPPMVLIVEGPDESEILDSGNVRFQWQGYDDWTSTANLEYNYILYVPLGLPIESGWVPDTSVQYNNLQNGNYLFEVQVRDHQLSEDQTPANRSFTILVLVPPVADPDGPYSGTVGVPVTFDGSGSYDSDGTIVSYDWNFGDTGTGMGVSPTHTYSVAGVYNVMLTVTDNDGLTDRANTTATITVLPGWDVHLTAFLDIYNDVSEFGVRLNASECFDEVYDAIDPVEPPIGVVSYFWHPDCPPPPPIDFRKLSISKLSPNYPLRWRYRVKPIAISGVICINWSTTGIAAIPLEYGVYLQCPGGTVINMRSTTKYCFNATADTTYEFKILVGGCTFHKPLSAGWNMISFPCLPANASWDDVLGQCGYYQVLTWDGTGYITPLKPEFGWGYWVLVLEDCNITIANGLPCNHYERNLNPGWSMIGSIFPCTVDANCVFAGYYQLLTWDGGGYVPSTTIEPGKGYWALVLEQTHIIVDETCCKT